MNNKMGVSSGVTRIFNIDRKLMLTDPILGENELGLKISHSVQTWISINPDFVWDSLYSGKIQLCKSAHELLMQTMIVHDPVKYKAMLKKKLQRKALKKAYQKLQ